MTLKQEILDMVLAALIGWNLFPVVSQLLNPAFLGCLK